MLLIFGMLRASLIHCMHNCSALCLSENFIFASARNFISMLFVERYVSSPPPRSSLWPIFTTTLKIKFQRLVFSSHVKAFSSRSIFSIKLNKSAHDLLKKLLSTGGFCSSFPASPHLQSYPWHNILVPVPLSAILWIKQTICIHSAVNAPSSNFPPLVSSHGTIQLLQMYHRSELCRTAIAYNQLKETNLHDGWNVWSMPSATAKARSFQKYIFACHRTSVFCTFSTNLLT